jgi:hypothetical protein
MARISQEQGVDLWLAECIMHQALAFIRTCADHPSLALFLSRSIDIGWHTFGLSTRAYADFCDRVAECFIHLKPEDTHARSEQARDSVIRDTVAVDSRPTSHYGSWNTVRPVATLQRRRVGLRPRPRLAIKYSELEFCRS